jgi:hypothetical protein
MEASGGADTAPMCRYDIGIEALRGDIGTADMPSAWDPGGLGDSGWRIEVLKRGKYWQWRRGYGKGRKARYGGRFALLPEARRTAYFENVRRRAAHAGGGPGDLPERRPGGQPGRDRRVLVAP